MKRLIVSAILVDSMRRGLLGTASRTPAILASPQPEGDQNDHQKANCEYDTAHPRPQPPGLLAAGSEPTPTAGSGATGPRSASEPSDSIS